MLPPKLKTDTEKYLRKENISTPRILYSEQQLVFNYLFIKKRFELSDQDIYFPVKTNNQLQVLKSLNRLSSNYEIGSLGELKLMQRLLISPKRILVSNPVKIPEHLSQMYAYGIRYFAFDTVSELEKIARYAPESKVFLRLTVSNEGAEWALRNKFGAPPEKATELLAAAQQRGLTPCGLAMHVGWNNQNTHSWQKALKNTEKLAIEIQQQGISLEFINLGGGFPAHFALPYPYLNELSDSIMPTLSRLRKTMGLRLIVEPGSFLVANTAVLLTRVYARIVRGNKCWLFLDTGTNQGFSWVMAGLEYRIAHTSKSGDEAEFVITGPTLDSHDVFSTQARLPQDTAVGDLLFIFPAGAYISSAQAYNGFSYPRLVKIR